MDPREYVVIVRAPEPIWHSTIIKVMAKSKDDAIGKAMLIVEGDDGSLQWEDEGGYGRDLTKAQYEAVKG